MFYVTFDFLANPFSRKPDHTFSSLCKLEFSFLETLYMNRVDAGENTVRFLL